MIVSLGVFIACSVEQSQSGQSSGQEDKVRDAELEAECQATEAKAKAATKQLYMQKLVAVENCLSDLQVYYDRGSQGDLTQAEYERYQRWDKALNEIWAQLKKDMPADQFAKLQVEQRLWIETRDRKADEAGKEMEGGTAEPMLR